MSSEGKASGRTLRYAPALDGLRAVCVLGVMVYHARQDWLPGGFLGVDVFFVLSGFLITSLLLVEYKKWRSLDLANFWKHRARRLLPALFLVTPAACVAAAYLEPADKLATVRGDALATLLYVANWRFILKNQSYFDQYGDPSPFRHMWSLGIEEQYYLVFPLILFGLLALFRRRLTNISLILAGGAVLSGLLMAALFDPQVDPSRVYFGTDTRAQELLVGATAAALVHLSPSFLRRQRLPRVVPLTIGLLGLGGLLVAFGTVHDYDAWLYRGGFFGLSVLAAVLIVSVTEVDHTPIGKLLSLKPLVWIGVISYGLYLWHWPIDVFVNTNRTGLRGTPQTLLLLVAPFAIAIPSYLLVERPIRRGRLAGLPRLPRQAIITLALPTAIAAVLLSTAGAAAPREEPWTLPSDQPVGADGHKTQIAVIGDSVGSSVLTHMTAEVEDSYRIRDLTTLGCGVGPMRIRINGANRSERPDCAKTEQRIAKALKKDPPAASILFYGAWETVDHYDANGQPLVVGTPAYERYLVEQLSAVVRAAAPTGNPVLVMNLPCYADTTRQGMFGQIADSRNNPERQAAVNFAIGTLPASFPNVHIVDLRSYVCPDGKTTDLGMRDDGVHFTVDGADGFWSWFQPQLDRIISADKPTRHRSDKLRITMVGDSVPEGLVADYLRSPVDPKVNVTGATKIGCGLTPETAYLGRNRVTVNPAQCDEFDTQVPHLVEVSSPDVGLVWPGIGEQWDRDWRGKVRIFGTPEGDAFLRDTIDRKVKTFTDLGVPAMLVNIQCHSVLDMGSNQVAAAINSEKRIGHVNQVVADYVAQHPQVGLIDMHSFLCSKGYTNKVDGITLRRDGLHFTPEGSAYVWKWLIPQAKAFLQKGNESPSAAPKTPGTKDQPTKTPSPS